MSMDPERLSELRVSVRRWPREPAAELRALLADRDDLAREVDRLRTEVAATRVEREHLREERDRAQRQNVCYWLDVGAPDAEQFEHGCVSLGFEHLLAETGAPESEQP